jgi:hypothetical protein
MIRSLARYVLMALAAATLCGCARTPQLNGDAESLGAADALWTAVTAKRTDLLEKSATRIDELHTAGKLPGDAFQSLQEVIEQARGGQWDDARRTLKAFVKGQRPVKRAGQLAKPRILISCRSAREREA